MEKADILELAVRHLKEIQTHPISVPSPSSTVLSKYIMGFQACATEVSNYLNTHGEDDLSLKSKLLDYLSNRLTDRDNPAMCSNKSSTSLSTNLPSSSIDVLTITDSCIPSSSVSGDFQLCLKGREALKSMSSTRAALISTLAPEPEDDSTLNQNLVSSSTQVSSKMSSSLSPSSSSTHCTSNQTQSQDCLLINDLAGQISSYITENRRINEPRESTIVKTRVDNGEEKADDNDSNSILDDSDGDGGPIVENRPRDKSNNDVRGNTHSNSLNIINDDGKSNTGNGSQPGQKTRSAAARNMITLPQPHITELPLNNLITLPQPHITELPLPLQHQNLFYQPFQQNLQNVYYQELQHQCRHTEPQLDKQHQIDQIYAAPMTSFPCMGSNVQLIPAQTNPNTIALVLPTNVLSTESIPKFYIPLLPPSTIQTSAAITIAPQVFQSNQITAPIQLDNTQATPITSGQIMPLARVDPVQTITTNTAFVIKNNECVLPVKSDADHNAAVIKKQLLFENQQEHLHQQQNTSPVNLTADLSTFLAQSNVLNNKNIHRFLSPASTTENYLSVVSDQVHIKSLQQAQQSDEVETQLQQQEHHQQQLQICIENNGKQTGPCRAVDFPRQYYNSAVLQGRLTQDNLITNTSGSRTFAGPQLLESAIILPTQNPGKPQHACSLSGITTLGSRHDDIISSSLNNTTTQGGQMNTSASTLMADMFKNNNSNMRKRSHSPFHDVITKNGQRSSNLNYNVTQETRDSNVLDLSIPGSRQESSSGTSVRNPYDRFQIVGAHSRIDKCDTPLSLLETSDKDTLTKFNDLGTGLFFRPW